MLGTNLANPADEHSYRVFFGAVLAVLVVVAAMVIALTYLVDPYAEAAEADGIYFASSPATIARYRDLLAREPFVVVFGTSRSRLFSDRFVGEKVLNFHALYGWPKPVLTFLQNLDEQRTHNIRRIIYLLDIQTVMPVPADVRSYPDGEFERFAYRVRNLQSYGIDSATRIARLATGNYRSHIHPRGFTVEDRRIVFGGEQLGVEEPRFDPAEVARLAEIQSFADSHHIPIQFITPVLPDIRLKAMNLDLLFAQRRAFAHALGRYFELTHISGISDRADMFADASHINTDGMRALFTRYPWKDRVATPDTLDRFLADMSKAASH